MLSIESIIKEKSIKLGVEMENYILEVCVDSVESAINANEAGANRLELCGNLVIGGTTPSTMLFKAIRKKVKLPIHVLIRPRYGDFCYSNYEFNIMLHEIRLYKKLGAEGIVIGVLNPDGNLDCERMKILIEEAGGMHVTLHRAFDMSPNPYQTLENAIELGVETILTSGQADDCVDGVKVLKELVIQSKGKVDILIGSGVSSGVIADIYQYTKATSFHMSGKSLISSKMIYRNDKISMGINGMKEYEIFQTKASKVREAVKILEEL